MKFFDLEMNLELAKAQNKVKNYSQHQILCKFHGIGTKPYDAPPEFDICTQPVAYNPKPDCQRIKP